VSGIALELERVLEHLDPETAQTLETRVREAISLVTESKAPPTLEEIKRRRPDLADIIGCWADMEFELPPELPLSPAKTW